MPSSAEKNYFSAQGKGVCLHASAISISGKALLFLGHSTAGKSTISRLLSECYPVIADDKVWVFRERNRVWMVRGLIDDFCLEAESERKLQHDRYPILSIIRLYKSSFLQIKPINELKACKYLMDAIFEIDFQRGIKKLKLRKKWFELAADISRQINGWDLTFPKDKSIIDLVRDVFDAKNDW